MSWTKELEKLEREIEKLRAGKVQPPPDDPVEFCRKILRFQPTSYQAKKYFIM
jgi:hypothetical protein